MIRFAVLLTGFLFLLSATPISTIAGGKPGRDLRVETDANIVTAIDVSGSIDLSAERLELIGMAEALVHPAFVHAIRSGWHKRIGFSVFTWSSAGEFVELVPWRIISSPGDAEQVSVLLRQAYRLPRMGWRGSLRAPRRPWRTGMATDISAAIEQALRRLSAAPFLSDRHLLNICANGRDNVLDGPQLGRQRAAAAGAVINGVILGERKGLADYFRQHVQTGPGSFVIEAREIADLTDAMLRKFVTEIAWRAAERGGT